MKQLLLFPLRYCLAVALLSGCTKSDGPTIVEGQMIDRILGTPVAGATV